MFYIWCFLTTALLRTQLMTDTGRPSVTNLHFMLNMVKNIKQADQLRQCVTVMISQSIQAP